MRLSPGSGALGGPGSVPRERGRGRPLPEGGRSKRRASSSSLTGAGTGSCSSPTRSGEARGRGDTRSPKSRIARRDPVGPFSRRTTGWTQRSRLASSLPERGRSTAETGSRQAVRRFSLPSKSPLFRPISASGGRPPRNQPQSPGIVSVSPGNRIDPHASKNSQKTVHWPTPPKTTARLLRCPPTSSRFRSPTRCARATSITP